MWNSPSRKAGLSPTAPGSTRRSASFTPGISSLAALRGQPLPEGGGGDFHRVHPRKDGSGAPGPPQYLQGGIVAVAPAPQLNKGGRDGIGHRKGGELVLGGRRGTVPPEHSPQYPVDEPRRLPLPQGPYHLHAFADGGCRRHRGEGGELEGAQAQGRPDLRLQLAHRGAAIAVQHPVQGDALLQHPIKEGRTKSPVLGGKIFPPEPGLQHQVGITSLLLHCQEGGRRCLPRVHLSFPPYRNFGMLFWTYLM